MKVLVLYGGFVFGAVCLQGLLNSQVPEAYMDEIFHFPQTQKYCQGDFLSWDAKITTFPGMYFFGVVFASISNLIGLTSEFCVLSTLRYLNALFMCGTLFLIYQILKSKYLRSEASLLVWHSFSIAIFPVHFFTSFLYYTDAGSVFFVILMYYLSESKQQRPSLLSGLVAAMAVLFRQTNIIWVLFVMGSGMLQELERKHFVYLYQLDNDCSTTKASEKCDKSSTYCKKLDNHCSNPLYVSLIRLVELLLKEAKMLIFIFWPFLIVVISFVAFFFFNGGIVVGDRQNHQMSLHLAQLMYFSFTSAIGLGLNIFSHRQIVDFLLALKRNCHCFRVAVLFLIAIATVFISIHYFSIVHPFILADNRHYTFYLWKNIFNKYLWMKYALIPVYTFCIFQLVFQFNKIRSVLWVAIYVVAVFLVLVPSPLVEFRYYIIPYIVMQLNIEKQSLHSMQLVCATYVAVNAVTIAVFLFRPFVWNDGSTARFMW